MVTNKGDKRQEKRQGDLKTPRKGLIKNRQLGANTDREVMRDDKRW